MELKQKLKTAIGVGLVSLLSFGGCSDLNKYFGKEEPKKEIIQKEAKCDPSMQFDNLLALENYYPSEPSFCEPNSHYFHSYNINGKQIEAQCECLDRDNEPKKCNYEVEVNHLFYKFKNNNIPFWVNMTRLKEGVVVSVGIYYTGNGERYSISPIDTSGLGNHRKTDVDQMEQEAKNLGCKVLEYMIQEKKETNVSLKKKIKEYDEILNNAKKAFGIK